jgi:lipopolysaccharide export system permease protein
VFTLGPRLVDRLIWRELFGPLLNSIFLFVIILFTSTYLIKVTDLLVQGASPALVTKVALFSLPMLITQTLPMGMLLGTILAFGRLSGDSEHIALYASGVSFFRIARPVAWLGILVGLVTILWNETVVPPATRELYRLMGNAIEDVAAKPKPIRYDLKRKGTDTVEQIVYIDGGYDPKARSLRRVTIVRMDEKAPGEPEISIYAERAVARNETGTDWDFYNANVWYMKAGPIPQETANIFFAHTRVLPHKVSLGKDFKGIILQENTDNRQMTFQQLRDKINLKRAQNDTTYLGDEFDLWGKIALPLASLIFGLVAAPLGIRPQRSSRTTMGFGIAIMIIFLYWVVHNWMFQVGKGGGLPPIVAAFTADAIGLVTAVVLIARTRQ